eukprot:CAMPEP_0194438782 /NCGR_PEP_ID=MMETSP0176-20130528/106868_1 /TAXON_ID=216777 /ORGANISM="Proboscia alata, Strain PI-D3" /LENGTH=222 /DNA_ID=CAMNT_0039261297 /DNA_START=120 /DNA_END=784 /DNA_ORIENTATION=+
MRGPWLCASFTLGNRGSKSSLLFSAYSSSTHSSSSLSASVRKPLEFLDGQFQVHDTMNNDSLHLLNDYYKNVVQSIEGDQKGNNLYPQELRNGARVKLIGSIYVQSMAGKLNVEWIESFVEAEPSCSIPAIVASCNLADDTLDFESLFLKLRRLDKVRGISTVTSTSSIRSASPSTPAFAAEFERGFAMLESHGLSLDWKGAPAQLPAAAELFGRYPNIPVA